MGQEPKKYHISDEGTVFRINDDGSFTTVGNVADMEKKSGPPTLSGNIPPIPEAAKSKSNSDKGSWWKRNYNCLWAATLVVFIGWFISCLSCAWPEYPQYDELGYISTYYTINNTGGILFVSTIIIVCFFTSWYLSKKDKKILKLAQIILVGGSAWVACLMLALCEQRYAFLLVCLAAIPLSIWIVTVCLSIFSRR